MTKKKEEQVRTEQVQTEMTIDGNGTDNTSKSGPEAKTTQNPPVSEIETPQEEMPELIPVVFLTNCTHNHDRYHAGQKEDLPDDVFEILLKAKAVRRLGE